MATTKKVSAGAAGAKAVGPVGTTELRVVEARGRGLVVSAKAVHGALGVGRFFANWIKDRIKRYGFEEGVDYWHAEGSGDLDLPDLAKTLTGVDGFSPKLAKNGPDYLPDLARNPDASGRGRGRPEQDYWLSLDMAKELAMLDRSEAGRRARKYFLKCELELRKAQEELIRLGEQAQLVEKLKAKQYQLGEADRHVFESIRELRDQKPLLMSALEKGC